MFAKCKTCGNSIGVCNARSLSQSDQFRCSGADDRDNEIGRDAVVSSVPATDRDVFDELFIEPYEKLAYEHFMMGTKCWLPWRRKWHYGFSEGLIAAADLIRRIKNKKPNRSEGTDR